MIVEFTRDSVCAGDDSEEHRARLEVEDTSDAIELVRRVHRALKLPHVAGPATWCLTSRVPLAVFAQGDAEPFVLPGVGMSTPPAFDIRARVLHVHACYMATIPPELVRRMLWNLKMTTP